MSEKVDTIEDSTADSGAIISRASAKLSQRIRVKGVKLYLGNEIYIDQNIAQRLKKGIISPLADSKYLLVELPMSGEYEGYEDIRTRSLISSSNCAIWAFYSNATLAVSLVNMAKTRKRPSRNLPKLI